MAGYYQFVFGNSATSDITVKYSTDGSTWNNYSEPGWPPSPSNQGSVLSVQQNDEIFVWLSGPTGWSMATSWCGAGRRGCSFTALPRSLTANTR